MHIDRLRKQQEQAERRYEKAKAALAMAISDCESAYAQTVLLAHKIEQAELKAETASAGKVAP